MSRYPYIDRPRSRPRLLQCSTFFFVAGVLLIIFAIFQEDLEDAIIDFSTIDSLLAPKSKGCDWSGAGKAWVEITVNGDWDSFEVGLAGVRFYVQDVSGGMGNIGASTTDWSGTTPLAAFIPGQSCDQVRLEIIPVAPPGYQLVTPAPLPGEMGEFPSGFIKK